LEAILQDDVALWEEAIHPVYGPSFSSITFVKKDILATGIDVNNYGLGSVTIVKYDVSDGSAIAAEFDLKITDGIWVKNRDILRIVYQESENGKGIIEIKLIDLP
ncbi:MAG: hypothetical protein J6Q54_00120, partial [Oscillospiraceae bacterium]|nr:hypothetical protein [Oscillospiraceae bacterium]